MEEPTYLKNLTEDDVKDVYEELNKITIPVMDCKRGRAQTFGRHRSLTLGYVKTRIGRKIGLSVYTKKYPKLYEKILVLGEKMGIKFTSIHINHNVVCPPHKDKNNGEETSCIVSLGNYSGGKLIINDIEYDTYLHPLVFDGKNNTHYNTDIQGNKYSLVFFSIQIYG